MVKSQIKRILIRLLVPALQRSNDSLNRLLACACKVYFGQSSPGALFEEIGKYYATIDIGDLKRRIDFDRLVPSVIDSGYKIDILEYKDEESTFWRLLGVWDKRLSLLRELGIRLDLMYLPQATTIPPPWAQGRNIRIYVSVWISSDSTLQCFQV